MSILHSKAHFNLAKPCTTLIMTLYCTVLFYMNVFNFLICVRYGQTIVFFNLMPKIMIFTYISIITNLV